MAACCPLASSLAHNLSHWRWSPSGWAPRIDTSLWRFPCCAERLGNERGPQASWKLGRLTVLLGDSVAYQAGLAVMCALEADYGARPVFIDGAGETGGLNSSLASDADALR